ncbi:transglycosylase family protein [Nocardioides ochotonae]|uniref:transglycosylase family protein n=1 Tax=Nocardioides ochotonae TaxID=2685869 RepID=UPI00140A0F75
MASTLSTLRARLGRITRSRAILGTLAAVVVLAVAGTTLGYSALTTTVTLSLDGESREVRAMGGTVGDVLESEGIEVGKHDIVAPGVEEEVSDGSKISVRFGRPLEVTIDGETQTYWVTSTEVDDALDEIGRSFAAARLSTSRGALISRSGLELEVVTPKKLTFAIAGRKPVQKTVTALTVREALRAMKVKVDDLDQVKPGLKTEVEDGDKIVLTDIRKETRRVEGERIDFSTEEREDASIYEGEEKVEREGRAGSRDVTYRLTYRNGEVVERKVVKQNVTAKPVSRIVLVGTKEKPAPAPAAPAPNYAGGDTVWDRLAQCESGGNWATNTGNGYYGGLQFSASTWAAVGGTGLPHQHSREEQIKRGQILQSRAGWGQWPHCSSQLGLR